MKEEHGKRTRELNTVRTAASAADEAAFDRWYDTYPRQVARGRARKVYARILKTKAATVDELQAGAERFARQRAGQNSQYTPYPSKWLSDECWRDEPEAAVVYAPAGAHASAVAGVFKGIDRGRSLDDEITDAAARSVEVGQRRLG